MEAVILIGIQGTGKSTFFKRQLADTHVRINLDMLRTRHRETILLSACIRMKQPFVVDNTNPSRDERARYIIPAREAGFAVIGYYFQSVLNDAISRNESRAECEQVPIKGIRGTLKRLQLPEISEGFDGLYYVALSPTGEFLISEWQP